MIASLPFASVLPAFVAAASLHAEAVNLDLTLPSTPGQQVNPRSPPSGADLLWKRHGPGFVVYWDQELGTPRYVSPRSRLLIARPEGGSEETAAALERGARELVSASSGFFGVSAEDLLGPEVSRVDESWLLTFRQTACGLPVRGASLALRIGRDGRLASISSFLARGVEAPPADLMDEELVRIHAREEYGVEVTGLERQIVFPTLDPASARRAWCLSVEYPDTTVAELFLDEEGRRIAERPLAMGFGVCFTQPRSFVAQGDAHGFSPHPQDIFATAASRLELHPLPDLVIKNHEGKRDLTREDGSWEMNVSLDFGIYWPELTFGECAAVNGEEALRPIFTIRRPNDLLPGNCNVSAPVVVYEEKPRDVASFFPFVVNEPRSTAEAFELMVFHHIRRFFQHSVEIMAASGVKQEDFFPLTVVVPRLDQKALPSPGTAVQLAAYTPNREQSRICLSRQWDRETLFPATVIHHEYAHHIIHAVTKTNLESEMLEGLADALAAYKNGSPQIGHLAPDDPGRIGFSLAGSVEALRGRGLTPERATVGRIFWKVHEAFRNKGDAENLLYRWLASNRRTHPVDRSLEFSMVMLESLLDIDDEPGDHGFDGADSDRNNGTPNQKLIVEAFADWIGEVRFLRGDPNASGLVDLSDPITILAHLFLGAARPACFVAGDADRSGEVDVSDAVYLLSYLFLAGPPPAEPFPECGKSDERMLWCIQTGCPGKR